MKQFAFLLLTIVSLTFASIGSLSAQTVPMPDYVLHAAQTLNAQYGANIDVNNVIWEYFSYVSIADATSECPDLARTAPAAGSNTIYLVTYKPVRNGVWGQEIWKALVYSDLSFVGLCVAPLPAITPSPGTFLPTVTPSNCGTMPSRLVIGQEARVAGTVPNNLRAEPFASGQYLGEIPAQAIFFVLDGPRCSSDGAWWQVNYNGAMGWTLEGQSGTYYLEPMSLVAAQGTAVATVAPFTPATAPIVCNPALPSRLIIGALARVTPGIPNNVRALAGSSSQLLGEIPSGASFTVLAGPTCASGVAWWQVNYNGMIGWTGEGADGDYWLEPEFAAFAPLSAANLSNSHQLLNLAQSNVETIQFSNGNALFSEGGGMIVRNFAQDSFAAPSALAWTQESMATSIGHFLALQAGANGLAWEASLDGTNVHVVYSPDGINFQENHLIGNMNISKAIFSPDGRYLMMVDNSQAIQVFDTTAGQILAVLPPTTGEAVKQLAFSPDGRVFAAGYTDGFVVWQVSNWAVMGSAFFDSPQSFQAFALNNTDFAFAVSSDQDAMAFVTPLQDINSWTNSGGVRHSSAALGLALDPNSNFLLIATATGLEVSPLPQGELLIAGSLSIKPNGTISQISISPDGRFLAISTQNGIELWGVSN